MFVLAREWGKLLHPYSGQAIHTTAFNSLRCDMHQKLRISLKQRHDMTLHRASSTSSGEFLDLVRDGAHAELALFAEHPLAGCPGRHAAEDHAIQQRVTAKAVVPMNTPSNLASRVEARDRLAARANHCGVAIDLQASHAIVDHGCDNGHVEGLSLHRRAGDDVVVELLA